MNALLFRTRVAVLWVAFTVAMAGSLVLFLVEPGALEDVLAGEVEGETLSSGLVFQMSLFAIIPLALAVVTLLVSDRVNGYTNLVAGSLIAVFTAVSTFMHPEFNAHVLMLAVASLTALLIGALSFVEVRAGASRTAGRPAEPSRPREGATA